MEPILIIANEFPPIGGSGVQRSINFVKHLPALGFQPIVATKAYRHGLYDDSLLRDIPDCAIIHRYHAVDLANRQGVLGRLMRFVATRAMIPDPEYFWYISHRRAVLKLVDDYHIGKIYSTSYPYSDHLMARYIKRCRPAVKWVADFRDEWTNNPYFTEHLHMKLRLPVEKKMELSIVDSCDYLVTNTPFMLGNFLSDSPLKRQRACFIPNGYNADDFRGYQVNNQVNSAFQLMYMGALYGKRKPDYLLLALRDLLACGDIERQHVQLTFIGNYHSHIMQQLADQFAIGDIMHVVDYMPHDQLLTYMSHANLLLLIESQPNFYTGKVFEYIRMGIPILATVPPEGAAASVVRETQTGDVVAFDDVTAIKASLLSRYRTWQRGEVAYQPNAAEIANYSWTAHAKSIIDCYESDGTP